MGVRVPGAAAPGEERAGDAAALRAPLLVVVEGRRTVGLGVREGPGC